MASFREDMIATFKDVRDCSEERVYLSLNLPG